MAKTSKRKKKKKKQTTNSAQMKLSRELLVIVFFFLAVFMFVTTQIPHSTGYVGQAVIASTVFLFGDEAVGFLPLFLILPSISFLISTVNLRTILATVTSSFVCYVILIEYIYHPPLQALTWPIPMRSGGLVGTILYFFFERMLGKHGTLIFISAIFSLSLIVLLGLSIKKSLKQILDALHSISASEKKKQKKASKKTSVLPGPDFSRLAQSLFYRRVSRPSINRLPSPKIKYPDAPVMDIPKSIPEPFTPEQSAPPEETSVDNEAIEEPLDLEPTFSNPVPDGEADPLPESEPELASDPSASAVRPPSKKPTGAFQLPPKSLLQPPVRKSLDIKQLEKHHKEQALILERTLESFKISAKVINITAGPSVTRFELKPGEGVKISKITNLSQDIALKLAAPDIRMEAPIPGKSLIGIEVPNTSVDMVTMRAIMDQADFYALPSRLNAVMGLTITGESIIMDLGKMPHVLIAGATGSGKSVCINTIILSILMRATPDEVKFLMIDPKKVELVLYDSIPHLLAPVVTDPNKAAATLKKWALLEMERRYEEFSKVGVKDLKGYNDYVKETIAKQSQITDETEPFRTKGLEPLPYIVVVIDELADLMMVAAADVETTICRLAQMARATGIHLVIATQRPSVNVVTGLIKANVPSRISFFLQSQIDSRTILDMAGAEKLLGKGDMLYSPVGSFKPKRVQGVFVSEQEVKAVVSWLKKQGSPDYEEAILNVEPLEAKESAKESSEGEDELYDQAKQLIINTQYASTSYLQRKLRIGYNRAARLMDELTEKGVIAQYAGERKPKPVAN